MVLDYISLIFKRVLFYIISFTWGIIMSLIGLLVLGFLAPFGCLHVYHGRVYAAIGHNGGGLELGCFFICSVESINSTYLCAHECGHGLQNCLWGPLFPLVIGIPSAIRYGYRELRYHRRGEFPKTQYDDIWFEGQATRGGKKYINTDRI